MQNVDLNKVSKYFVVLIFILCFFLIAKTLVEIKEFRFVGSDVYPQNVITMEGFGEVFAIPDTATFSFSVVEEANSSEEVQVKALDKVNAVIEALKKEGIEEKDIKTIGYNLYPRYENSRSGQTNLIYPPTNRVLAGYEIDHTISVKVRKIDDAGKILGLVGQMGVSNLSSLGFTIGDEEEYLEQARKLAIDDAKEKAQNLSKDLGVRLVRIVSFSEGGHYPLGRGAGEDAKFLSLPSSEVMPEIPVGENQIISQVYITYEIK